MDNDYKTKINNIFSKNLEKVNNFYIKIIISLFLLLILFLFLYLFNNKGFNKYLGIYIFLTLTILIILFGLLSYYNILVSQSSKYKNIFLLLSSFITIGLILLFSYNIGLFNERNINSKFNTNLLINYIIFIIFLTIALILNYKEYKISNMESLSSNLKILNNERMKYSILFFIYVLIIIGLYIYNPYDIMKKYSGITIFSIIFIGLVLFSMITIYNYNFNNPNKVSNNKDISNIFSFFKFLYIILALFISGLLIYFLLYIFGVFNQNIDHSAGYYIFNILLLLGILTILYKLVFAGGYLNKNPLFRLVTDTLLYIPCFFNNLINIIQNSLKNEKIKEELSSKNDLFFLLLSIILIILYFVLDILVFPLLKKYFYIRNGRQYIDEPIDLYNKNIIASYEQLNNKIKSDYSYGLSFWFYINSFQQKSKILNILDFGGNPTISYNGLTNTLLITINKNKLIKNKKYKVADETINDNIIIYNKKNFKLQKWHNIVINYNRGILDIFLNNELVSSSIKVVPYLNYDSLVSGEENGLQGSICNLIYYKEPISILQINNIYVNLQNKNPPKIN